MPGRSVTTTTVTVSAEPVGPQIEKSLIFLATTF